VEFRTAIRRLIQYAGDDPDREGLEETPDRVLKAFDEWFAGYDIDPSHYLQKTFGETEGYDEMVLLKDISFVSHCEHHMVPFIGVAHVGYIPNGRVVGISKLARVVDAYARRLQLQEKLTQQIADCIEHSLDPLGVGVVIEATHQCMSLRGIRKESVTMTTSCMKGVLLTKQEARNEFLTLIG
jgi:GTP cyclohydrolase I